MDYVVVRRDGISLIAAWGLPEPQPTPAQLDAVTEAQADAAEAAWAEARGLVAVAQTLAKRLATNVSTTSATLQDVAALAFQLAPARHYAFEFHGAYTAQAGTTGIQLAVSGPPSPAAGLVIGEVAESATARRVGVTAAYNTPLAGQNGGGATPLPFGVRGNISTGAVGGPLTLRACSEINGSQVTILAGSYALLHCIG